MGNEQEIYESKKEIAMQQYGFDYADMLHASEWGMQQ